MTRGKRKFLSIYTDLPSVKEISEKENISITQADITRKEEIIRRKKYLKTGKLPYDGW